ncbi:class I SAM-dependent methyltransferase, partial [Acinetobacter baumannii]
VAHVLARTLRPPATYDGFDVMPEAIAWCRRHYRGLPVPFRFVHADIHNALYNPSGSGSAADFPLPYADGAFDLVFATSVFTHLLADAA